MAGDRASRNVVSLVGLVRFARLVDNKAWQHLGLTGREFRALWHDGAFEHDERPEVEALGRLVRTGNWGNPPTF